MFKPSLRFKLLGATVLSTALITTGLVVAVTPSVAASTPVLGPLPPDPVTQSNAPVVDPIAILAYRKTTTTPAQVAQRFSSVDSQTVRLKGTVALDENTASSRVVTVTVPNGSAPAVLASMEASGLYDAVQLDRVDAAQYSSTPSDPWFSQPSSYGLKSGPGGSNFSQVWPSLTTAAPSASAPIADLDTGFDLTHEDLVNSNVKAGWNVADNNSNVSVCDGSQHGTITAGIIGAQTDNGKDIAGAGYDATVKVYRISTPTVDCDGAAQSTEADAILRAAQDGAKVINLSFGGPGDYPDVLCKVISDVTNAGTLVVVSSGNNGNTGNPVDYPAACPDAMSVTNTDSTGTLAVDANTASNVAIAAPGTDVAAIAPNNVVGYTSGTSYSAPYVTAAASLLMRLVPTASVPQIRAALVGNGNPVTGAPQATYKILDVKKAYDALLKTASPLSVSAPTLSLAGAANSIGNVTVTANGAWTASSNQSWLTLSPASGAIGSSTLTATAAANPGTAARTATVTVRGPNNSSVTVTVTQAGQAITVSIPTWAPAATASSTSVTVASTGAWTATSNQSWVAVSPATGAAGSRTVTFTVPANTTGTVRTATVTFATAGGSATVQVTQAAAALSVSSPTVTLTGAMNYPPGYVGITATSTGAWTASSNQSWLGLSQASGGVGNTFVTFSTTTANLTGAPRTATVTFRGPNSSTATVTVTQVAQPIAVSVTSWLPAATASSTSVTVAATGNWTASSNQSWLTVSPASGVSGSRAVTLTAAANTAGSLRVATVTFTGPDGNTATVQVGQAQPPLAVSSNAVSVGSAANSSGVVSVASTGAWTATSNQSWLSLSPVSGGSGNTNVTLVAAANTSTAARTATVTIRALTGGATTTVTVTQTGTPIAVSSSLVSLAATNNSSNVTVTATNAWTASSNQPWLTVSPASGASGSRSTTLTATANTTTSTRTAVVTFTTVGGSVTVQVTQAAASLVVSTSEVTLASIWNTPGYVVMTVTSTGAWTASSNQSWLGLSPASGGAGTSIGTFTTTNANPSSTPRVATVTVRGPNSSTATVTVTQVGK